MGYTVKKKIVEAGTRDSHFFFVALILFDIPLLCIIPLKALILHFIILNCITVFKTQFYIYIITGKFTTTKSPNTTKKNLIAKHIMKI
jgi:hypothetical protein